MPIYLVGFIITWTGHAHMLPNSLRLRINFYQFLFMKSPHQECSTNQHNSLNTRTNSNRNSILMIKIFQKIPTSIQNKVRSHVCT